MGRSQLVCSFTDDGHGLVSSLELLSEYVDKFLLSVYLGVEFLGCSVVSIMINSSISI